MPNGFHSFEEWQKLKPEVKEYTLYTSLYDLQKKVSWKRIFGISGIGAAFGVGIVNSPHIISLCRAFL
jgi:hypothetical protein